MADRHADDGDGNDSPTNSGTPVDRRSYLKMAGATAVGAAALSGVPTSRAATTVDGISFDRVVNIVDDYGADNTGNDPIDSELESAVESNTLIEFPEGQYKINNAGKVWTGVGNLGFIGLGDVQWIAPWTSDGMTPIANIGGRSNAANKVLMKNIDIDVRQEGVTAGFKFLTQNGFHVENVEFLGRGNHHNYPSTGEISCFIVRVANSSGVGVLKNVVAKKGSHWARYGQGRSPLYASYGTYGTIRVIDCHFEEFGGSGIYASGVKGNVQVEGGLYRNNNGQAMRFGGEGSYADGVRVEIDASKYTGDYETEYYSNGFRHRGIVINQKTAYMEKPPGAEIRNCEIVIEDHPSPGPAVFVRGPGKTVTIRNTDITVNNDSARAVYRQRQTDFGKHPASTGERWVRMEDVHIHGDGAGGDAVYIADGDGTDIKNCCVQQTGTDRDGVCMVRSDGAIGDTAVNVTGQALDFQNCSVNTSNISTDETCDGSSGSSGNSDLPNRLTITGNGDPANYEFTVSGALEEADWSLESWDTIDGSTANGWVTDQGSSDAYAFDGEVTAFDFLEGDATVSLNGETVDPATLGSDDSSSSDGSTTEHTLYLEGGTQDYPVEYRFQVSGTVAAGDLAGDNDTVGDSEVQGQLSGDADNYAFTGDITAFEASDDLHIELDGEILARTDLPAYDDGSTDGTSDSSKTLTVTGTGSPANYEFSVSGSLAEADGTLEQWDTIEGSTANGWVTDDGTVDTYAFDGDVTAFDFHEGDATVTIDGQEVDPATLGDSSTSDSTDNTSDSSRTLTVTGIGNPANYEFGVSGSLAEAEDSLESWDTIDGSTATGWVTDEGSSDVYTFDGEVTSFDFLEGDATVAIDGEMVDPATLGSSDTSHTLSISGTGSPANYEFTVSGDLAAADDSLERWDTIEGSTANGWVTQESHADTYTFDGEVTAFDLLEGDATVTLDGEPVDPSTLTNDG